MIAHDWAKQLPVWSTRGWTVSVAESCTGGLFAAALTSVPGASHVFLGGVVVYSNESKRSLLGVSADAMRRHGAISEPVARAMAEGCRERFGSDVAVSITGIAGPGGGSEQKPVGLTFIALACRDGVICRRFQWDGDRAENRCRAVKAAFDLLSEWQCRADD